MNEKIIKKINLLSKEDCFISLLLNKSSIDAPLHYHDEFELSLLLNGRGSKRIVGDSIEITGNTELVLLGAGLKHGWFTQECKNENITLLTTLFHKDLFNEKFLNRNQMYFIKKMFEKAERGIIFSKKTALQLTGKLNNLKQTHDFDSILDLMFILHQLSLSKDIRIISNSLFNKNDADLHQTNRISAAIEYINRNFTKHISLGQVANIVNMSESSFSRFLKVKTGKTFIDLLVEIRIGHATHLLINSPHSIREIAYKCGFNNMSNFNRVFKKKKGCSPKEFKRSYTTVAHLYR